MGDERDVDSRMDGEEVGEWLALLEMVGAGMEKGQA